MRRMLSKSSFAAALFFIAGASDIFPVRHASAEEAENREKSQTQKAEELSAAERAKAVALIEALGSSDFDARQQALETLQRWGAQIGPVLEEELEKSKDDEVKTRGGQLLRQLNIIPKAVRSKIQSSLERLSDCLSKAKGVELEFERTASTYGINPLHPDPYSSMSYCGTYRGLPDGSRFEAKVETVKTQRCSGAGCSFRLVGDGGWIGHQVEFVDERPQQSVFKRNVSELQADLGVHFECNAVVFIKHFVSSHNWVAISEKFLEGEAVFVLEGDLRKKGNYEQMLESMNYVAPKQGKLFLRKKDGMAFRCERYQESGEVSLTVNYTKIRLDAAHEKKTFSFNPAWKDPLIAKRDMIFTPDLVVIPDSND